MGILNKLRRKPSSPAAPAPDNAIVPMSFFSTQFTGRPLTKSEELKRRTDALSKSVQQGFEKLKAQDATGKDVDFAMDEAYMDLTQAKIVNSTRGYIPLPQLEWYGQQGFIGWQMCGILAQNWLIDKACTVPAQDAIRHGWEIATTDGTDLDPKVLEAIRRGDKKFQMKRQCREFVKNGRIFGIRHAMFIIEGIDYSAPFNPDGIRPGSYKGITQIDPYWIAPVLDGSAAGNPAAPDFYEPTWWQVNGKRVHRSHFCIMRNGDQVTDILKPSYLYGGIPVPQKIYERVYAAERTANEAPMLAMTKRLTCLKLDLAQAAANPDDLNQKMEFWMQLQNNFGVKIIGQGDELEQFDTSLQDLDETIMTQYQLVAAAANMPATKLLGTSPKGFNASGLYEEASYHEELESIQEHDLSPLIEGHHIRLIRSEIMPKFDIPKFSTEVAWKPVDSPTALELAEINQKKADTDNALVQSGGIDGFDVRQRLINDPDSGYNGIEAIVPGGPGDREAEQAAEAALVAAATAQPDTEGDNGGEE